MPAARVGACLMCVALCELLVLAGDPISIPVPAARVGACL